MNAKKSGNPVLQRKFDEGFKEGYALGFQAGIDHSSRYFLAQFQKLEQTEGIGPKTMDKLMQVFDGRYFEKKEAEHKQSNNQTNNQTNNNQTTK